MKPKISLITLGVSDLDRSIAFYRDGLSLPMQDRVEGEDMIFFALEGTWLGLYPKEKLREDFGGDPQNDGWGGVTLAHNVESKEEVDALFAQAVAVDARAVKEPQEVFWGGYSGYFADPDGHLWEVAYNPFMDLT